MTAGRSVNLVTETESGGGGQNHLRPYVLKVGERWTQGWTFRLSIHGRSWTRHRTRNDRADYWSANERQRKSEIPVAWKPHSGG